ncbi:MAG: hypothetical protein DRN64_01890 [Thaumarchaeota archaeon]|nr:MAG: hypothetical protein DRN64_01890 [Nitrososphaerota archaeon]
MKPMAIALATLLLASPFTATSPAIRDKPDVIIWYDNVNESKLLKLAPKLLIVDPGEVERETIRKLQKLGTEVIAYVNLGMAEEWRSYWKERWRRSPPRWIAEKSREWSGEYVVMFWHPAWRRILRRVLKSIEREGYDGILLDNIDVYEYWEEKGCKAEEKLLMIIKWIKLTYSGKIYVNIGSGLKLIYDEEFMKLVDGILREEVWASYRGVIDPEETKEILNALIYAKQRGKDVVILDYSNNERLTNAILSECAILGFKCYIGSRDLNSLPKYLQGS